MKNLDFKIDYNNPKKYLVQGEQTEFIFTDNELKTLKKEIGELRIDKDLHKIINFINKNKKTVEFKNDERKFKRTAKEIFETKEYTGCTDYAVVFATILRQLGFPAVCVEAADVDWIEEAKKGTRKGARGHNTCEVFIDNKWVHVDPTAKFIDGVYDKSNKIITYGRGEKRQVFWKGIDLFEIGIKSTKDMVELMQKLVHEDECQK